VLLVLLIIPGGLGDLVYRLRDNWLRWIARRQDIIVPSLLADVAQPGDDPDPEVIVHAEQKVDQLAEDRAQLIGPSEVAPEQVGPRADHMAGVLDRAAEELVAEQGAGGPGGEVGS